MPVLERGCPVCQQDESCYWFRPSLSPGPVVRCKECGFVYVNPIETTEALIQQGPNLGDYHARLLESSNLDDIEGSWEQSVMDEYLRELACKEVNAKDALARIVDLAESPGTLLDIGCFCGVFLSVASRAGWDCYGVEPLVMPAVYARGHYGLRVVCDTLRDDSYPLEFFDVVTSFQVFEHLVHPDQQIGKIARVLRPGGLLVVEVPNIDTVWVKLLRSRHRHFVQDHVSFFSASTLGFLLESSGFQVREVYYPTRAMSLGHFVGWLERGGRVFKRAVRMLPRRLLAAKCRINLYDIVTVIAQKKQ
jgi:2-polyprenyl-3-methyl-5-hydroxy-6-metoxy-1,4-benzoquinol methylase